MIYTATLTSATLRLSESRIIADLLLQGLGSAAWKAAIIDQNVLQQRTDTSATSLARILRARLEPLGKDLWTMVRDGPREQATQAVFAGMLQHSRLLGDFLRITLHEQRARFAKTLDRHLWSTYIDGCRGRDPDMPRWSDSTLKKLRSSVFSILVEVGYLKDARSLLLQNVFIDSALKSLLQEQGQTYSLICLEVSA